MLHEPSRWESPVWTHTGTLRADRYITRRHTTGRHITHRHTTDKYITHTHTTGRYITHRHTTDRYITHRRHRQIHHTQTHHRQIHHTQTHHRQTDTSHTDTPKIDTLQTDTPQADTLQTHHKHTTDMDTLKTDTLQISQTPQTDTETHYRHHRQRHLRKTPQTQRPIIDRHTTHTHTRTHARTHARARARARTHTHTHTQAYKTCLSWPWWRKTVEKAVAQGGGTCPQRPVPPPRRQQLEQDMCWVGPVCSDPSASGDRPLSECRRQQAPNDSPGFPDVTVHTSLLVLCGAATPDWKREAQHAFYDGPVKQISLHRDNRIGL